MPNTKWSPFSFEISSITGASLTRNVGVELAPASLRLSRLRVLLKAIELEARLLERALQIGHRARAHRRSDCFCNSHVLLLQLRGLALHLRSTSACRTHRARDRRLARLAGARRRRRSRRRRFGTSRQPARMRADGKSTARRGDREGADDANMGWPPSLWTKASSKWSDRRGLKPRRYFCCCGDRLQHREVLRVHRVLGERLVHLVPALLRPVHLEVRRRVPLVLRTSCRRRRCPRILLPAGIFSGSASS